MKWIALAIFACACGGASSPTCPGPMCDSGIDGGGGAFDSGGADARIVQPDSGPMGRDAQTSSDAMIGAMCDLNRECASDQRCTCPGDVCTCQMGARGAGQLGASCDDGDTCASALCVEGPVTDTFFCSVECESDADCGGALPRCVPIGGIGMICIREPPT
jgi:hypothetical protein